MKRYRAIFFDFGDTLAPVSPVPLARRLRQTYEERFAEAFDLKLPKEDAELLKLHEASNQQAGWPVEEDSVEAYERVYTAWARGLLTALRAREKDIKRHAAEFAEAFRDISDRSRVAYPDCVPTLEALKARGYRLAVISNNDGRLLRRMTYMGLTGYFELIADSSVVQSSKPDAGIFKHGLNGLGVQPAEVLHVGDLYHADVEGAGPLGIDAVWIKRTNKPAPESAHRPRFTIAELAELPPLLDDPK
ncbi:MAG: HAD family hydrolase [Planctomycetes bacterium]|nr:HAD family hydrolase [Planctomycetota bacterium]